MATTMSISRTWLAIIALVFVVAVSAIGRTPERIAPGGTSTASTAATTAAGGSPSVAAPAASIGASTSVPILASSGPVSSGSTVPVLGAAPAGPTERARVVRVVDGDTIVVDRGFGEERLRYIGVDTPETVDPREPVEWMGLEASAANKALVEGGQVVLERDVSETDSFGRLLRYVWLEDGWSVGAPAGWLLVNLELVARGFAQVATYPPDVRYVDLLLAAQRTARQQGLGLWGEPPEQTDEPGGGEDNEDDCDPAYPGVCIPPPPPDLDCGDIPHRRFEVRAPDPHRFDGDADGLGCES